jgi:hypothetical protein
LDSPFGLPKKEDVERIISGGAAVSNGEDVGIENEELRIENASGQRTLLNSTFSILHSQFNLCVAVK